MKKIQEYSEITIITCAMKFHDPFLITNYEQLRKNNRNIKWIIVNNDSSELEISKYNELDPNLNILTGPTLDRSFGKIAINIQHSTALKIAANKVNTGYVIILDPDFIVLDWNFILNFCFKELENNFKAIATPWFVTWYSKKTKSIAPHFVFSKTSLLIDNFPWYPLEKIPMDWRTIHPDKINIFKIYLARNKIFNSFLKTLLNRRRIDSEFDTLGDTYLMGERNEVSFFEIHVTRNQLKSLSPHLNFKIGRFLEKFVPQRYNYLSKKIKITEFELHANCQNIEHYGSNGEIWGVHMRGFGSGKLMKNDQQSIMEFSDHLAMLNNGSWTLKLD
jgi:hypothetical protein